MIKSSILILIVSVACLVAGDARVRHLQLNNAHLIETSPANFAVVSPLLTMQNWKTVSVNGNNLVITSANCQQAVRTLDSLSDAEKQLILNAKQQLATVESNHPQSQEQIYRSGSACYALNSQSVSMSFGRNIQLSSFSSNGFSLTRYDENNLSISKPNLPNNIARVFLLNQDVVGYVFYDGQVQMKPLQCAQGNEAQMIQQLKLEAQQSERQFQLNMQQFNQNMANMQQNLQQNMQNMQMRLQQNMQNLNGMFNRPPQQQQQQYQQQQYQQRVPTQSMYQQPASQAYANNGMAYAGGMPGGAYVAPNAAAQAISSGNFPFGPNNSPFYPGFPFRR